MDRFRQLCFPKVEVPESTQQGSTCLWCASSSSHALGTCWMLPLPTISTHALLKPGPQVRELPCCQRPHCLWSWLFAMATALHSFLLKPLYILTPNHPSHLPLASLAPDPLLGLTRIILLSLGAPCAPLLRLQRSQVAAAVEIVTQTFPALWNPHSLDTEFFSSVNPEVGRGNSCPTEKKNYYSL